MEGYLTVGKIARQSGVNLQTVLYYERRRLLSPARRSDSGYRLYAPETVRVIRFIKNAQALGFTLDEIAKLLRLRVSSRSRCEPVKRQAQARLELVQGKIAGLRAMERTLRRLLKTCAARGTTDSCPILESLESRK
ncbi:MAG: MerR family transcriptional regulator [Elusimicrobia bacterium]|nr:MerR family transcriptional regulator [Elusimicrobiota bacterium]MDP3540911.1 MerR family transcriptional regulator [Elusimicrobiota bacterium]